jgi:hypothetical protein
MSESEDRSAIDALIGSFFAAFDNRAGRIPVEAALLAHFADLAVVAKHHDGQCELASPAGFAAPRVALLKRGELVDFHEWEVSSETSIFGTVAIRTSRYSKSGSFNGAPYAGTGTKFFQLARLEPGWRIVALSWIDDP